MVGKSVAVFTACETKSKHGKASDEQLKFIEAVNNTGGIAFVARSSDEALREIEYGKNRLRGTG